MSKPLLQVENLKKYFRTKSGILHAVDDVSFTIDEGKTLGVVGESGCGKSTTGRAILRLTEPTSGKITFDGLDVNALNSEELRKMRTRMQIIFQDPFSSLNPRMTVSETVREPLMLSKKYSKQEIEERAEAIMTTVGLSERLWNSYPHELDGGRRQRIGIARALILNPEFVVCDEAVSALDVSVRAQVLNLMKKMQEKRGLTYLFISHDLSVVRHVSDRVAVMYLGSVVEVAEKRELYGHPLHPYTKALLSAIPIPDANRKRQRIILEGDVPSAYNPPAGCKFHTRCPYATDRCRQEVPALKDVGGGHMAACHLLG